MKKISRKLLSMILVFVMTLGIAIPVSASTFEDKSFTFSDSSEEDAFGCTYLGWSVSEGVYRANGAWANTYMNEMIPFDADKEISFDFILANDEATDHQFNVGLVKIDGTTVSDGLTAHFRYYSEAVGNAVTLNGDFGNVNNLWKEDKVTDYFDGQSHTMTITVTDKKAVFAIDGNAFESQALGLDSAYLIFQATSTEYYIDNLKIISLTNDTTEVSERILIDFGNTTDGDEFACTYAGWNVADGVYHANSTWANTYLKNAISFETDKKISFDFTLANDGATDHQFNVGLVKIDGTTVSDGLTAHFRYYSEAVGNAVTLNGDFGNVSNLWKEDKVTDYFDGQSHTMTITVTDKTAVFAIDGNTFEDQALGLDSAYLIFQATSTEYSIDNLKIVKNGISDDYSEDFDDLSAFDKVQYATGVSCTDNQFVGTGWSGLNYKLPVENYRLDMSIKLNAEPSSANENRLYFSVPNITSPDGSGGYLLHFYNNSTYLFDNSITRSGWYDSNAIISKFTNPANFQNDGSTHTLTIVVLDNQMFMLIDGKFFTYLSDDSNIDSQESDIGAGYIRFIGQNWEMSQFDIMCFGGSSDMASAHFNGIHSIYEAVEALDQASYSEYSWNQVIKLRDEYFSAMAVIKDGTNATAMATLATEAVAAIQAVPEKTVVPEDVVGENQVLIGYQISGGSYGEGGLYNYAVGDELPEGDDIVLEPVVANVYMQAGTSVRLKDGAGMRWKTVINKSDYEELVSLGATFGTRITSTGSTKYLDIPVVDGLNVGETENSFVGAVTNIKTANNTRVYSGCGYITVTYADGTTDTKFVPTNDNHRTYKYLVSKALGDISDTEQDGYANAVQKDDETVYSPYTASQYNFLKSIYSGIKSNETAVVGTGAQIHILNVSGGTEVIEAGRPGNALSMLITYNDINVLIDAGAIETKDIVKNYLDAQGITKLDYVIATHAHEDHVEALPYMIENFEVGTLIYKEPDWTKISSASTDKALHDAVITAANSKNVTLIQPNEEGYKISLGEDTYLQIFNCTDVFTNMTKDDLNYYSLQTYVVSGSAKAFLASDSVGLFENEGLLDYVGKVDLYQAQHHGQGGDYSPQELIDVLQPKATVGATNNSTFIEQMNASCGHYGKTYATGDAGHLVFENTYGSFQLKRDAEDTWNAAQKVTIEATELSFDTDRRKGTDGNAIIDDWIKPGTNSGTAFVLNVPDNMTQSSVINIEGGSFYIEGAITDNRIRIILNDCVIYDSNVSGLDGDALDLTFTVSAGDKVYFIAEGTGGSFRMPMEMAIDGKYFCVNHVNHIDPTNDSQSPASNGGVVYDIFGGLSDKGTYYTRAELLSYMSVTVTEVQ